MGQEFPFALIAGCFLTGIIVTAFLRSWNLRRPQLSLRHYRGRTLRDAAQVREQFPKTPTAFRWGGCFLPHKVAYGHFAAVGATGSGKTMLQRLFMQSVLPSVRPDSGQRALIYDAKQDMLALLGGMGIAAPIHILNPLDARSVAWDIATDVTSPAAALQAASLLIPKASHDANPFFSNAARHLLHGVLLALILCAPKRWTLRQAILILRDEKLLQRILRQVEATRYLLQYTEHTGTFQNILSTILTRVAPYEIIAAAWDRAFGRMARADDGTSGVSVTVSKPVNVARKNSNCESSFLLAHASRFGCPSDPSTFGFTTEARTGSSDPASARFVSGFRWFQHRFVL